MHSYFIRSTRFLKAHRDISIFLLITLMFLLLRSLFLGSDYLWLDNVWKLSGGLQKIPWSAVLEKTLTEMLASCNPFLPMLLYRVILNTFGPHILYLRLPAILISLLSLYILHRSLLKLFSIQWARYLPQILFTLSVPSIIYSRQLHQTMFYFFSTMLQFYLFLTMVQELTPVSPLNDIRRKIQVFTCVSIVMLLVNWMSLLIYGMLISGYFIIVCLKTSAQPNRFKRLISVAADLVFDAIPLVILAFLRFRLGGTVREYLQPYYVAPGELVKIPSLAYDLLLYHFNFAYTTDLYFPLKANLISLPFVILFLIGMGYFMLKRKWHIFLWTVGVVITLIAVFAKAMPFGGMRHSFTLAPFLFIFVGYGIEALHAIKRRYALSLQLANLSAVGCLIIAVLTFSCSGSSLYSKRKSRVNLATLQKLAEQYQIDTIAGFQEAYDILAIMDYSAGNPLKNQGIQLRMADQNIAYNSNVPSLEFKEKKSYLIVTCRTPLPLSFPLEYHDTTILVQDFGPILQYPEVAQSIYYPINGFFVYLATGKKVP